MKIFSAYKNLMTRSVLLAAACSLSGCLGVDDNSGEQTRNSSCSVLAFQLKEGESGSFEVLHKAVLHQVELKVNRVDDKFYELTEIRDGITKDIKMPYANCEADTKDLSVESLMILSQFPTSLYPGYPFCSNPVPATESDPNQITTSCSAPVVDRGADDKNYEETRDFLGQKVAVKVIGSKISFESRPIAFEESVVAKDQGVDLYRLSSLISSQLNEPAKADGTEGAIIASVKRMSPLLLPPD